MYDKKINIPEIIKLEKVTLKKTNKQFAEERIKVLLENLDHIAEFLPFAKPGYNINDEYNYIESCDEKWDKGTAYDYSVFENSTGQYIVSYCLFAKSVIRKCYEFGYWIAKDKEGNGYVTQAIEYLTNLAQKELDANRVIIHCRENNIKSANVAKRNGYLLESKEYNADFEHNAYCFVKVKDKEKEAELLSIQKELKKIYKLED